MKRILFAGLMALPLAGCITSQEQQIAADDDRCLSYGVAKGTPAYVDCRTKLDANRSNVQAAQGFGQGVNNGGLVGAISRASSSR